MNMIELEQMEKAGVTFNIPDPTGCGFWELNAASVVDYMRDPKAWIAKKYNVSKLQYEAWYAFLLRYHRGEAFCTAKTRKGKPCRNLFVGADEPADFVIGLSDRCECHGGISKHEHPDEFKERLHLLRKKENSLN